MRGSFDGILSTNQAVAQGIFNASIKEKDDLLCMIKCTETQATCNRSFSAKLRDTNLAPAKITQNFELLRSSCRDEEQFKDARRRLCLEADARSLADFIRRQSQLCLQVLTSLIIFQCPWSGMNQSTGPLIQAFLQSAADVQEAGDLVAIGILERFEHNYSLTEVRKEAKRLKYVEIEDSRSFIRAVLAHGYQHTKCSGTNALHFKVLDEHRTIAFQKV